MMRIPDFPEGARSVAGRSGARADLRIATDRLALRPKDAAAALGIGQRMLWQLTHPRGPIPCVKVGTCILYPVALLQKWLAEQATREVKS